jgi:hypothetical protein
MEEDMQESALHRDADFANAVAQQAAVKVQCNWRGHAAAASRPHAAESTQKSLATAPWQQIQEASPIKMSGVCSASVPVAN